MIAIIDYQAGNIASVVNALKRLGISDYQVVNQPLDLKKATKVIFPGVGRAAPAMLQLKKQGLDLAIKEIRVPFLGICLGQHLLADFSYEDEVDCLGIIPGKVRKLPLSVKIPQIGWNKVFFKKDFPLSNGIPDGSYFYFVNSYYFNAKKEFVISRTSYGIDFPSIVQKENFYATQFHPEKSAKWGSKLLQNFCEL